ncbi:peptidylprolyl isomerase SurA [Psychrosphaera ytuae]|uniref:Chaperone SurA n=1 Tax=Psychrosphaera ytuae TaxID=2820710 RepID=A0A975HJW6_9GAMM|nr:peptidylprolyl isomerase SurA [Psychrosphaera ytuae]QTH63674.1 peptidylprolyl isomerase SurA [Psychrosphaera ytuae]
MFKKSLLSALLLGAAALSTAVSADVKKIDEVAVVVDDGVVLEGEIRDIVRSVKAKAAIENQRLPTDDVLRTQAIEKLILESLQLQLASRMGIQISDAQLDSVLMNIAQSEGKTIEEYRQSVIDSGENFEQHREKVRSEITISETMRANVRRRVNISEQEVKTLLEIIEQQTSKEEFNIGHILINVDSDATQADITTRKDVAEKVIELLEGGADFKQVAITSSSGAKALEGGDWGFLSINEMPSLFAENVKGQKKGDIIGPLKSGAGFHIIKILDIRGRETVEIKEVKSRHILIKPSIILSEEKAKKMLEKFVADVKAGNADFSELAKEHSEDPGSASRGGELGWANPDIYAPQFKETLGQLSPGQFSAPFRTQFGWHVVQLLDERTSDATEDSKKDRAYQILFNRKFAEEKENWLRELRSKANIEAL